MSSEQAQAVIDHYFELMGRDADFAECYSAEVTWLVADTGQVVRGPEAVRDFIIALHGRMTDGRTNKIVVGSDSAYLEGDCAATSTETGDRTYYCVAYDIQENLIVAMRCYGLGSRSTG